MYLAIDTSTDTAGLALFEDGVFTADLSWHSGQNHTTELLPNLNQLLKKHDTEISSVKGVVVARGPGSFNGLRVGLSVAKGLAFSLGIPIVGFSTLAAESYRYVASGLPVCPIFEAGRCEIATAIYRQQDSQWHCSSAEHITTVTVLASGISENTLFCGESSPTTTAEIKRKLKSKAIFPPMATSSRITCLAQLGLERLNAGDSDDLASLQPLYLRRPPITRSKKIIRLSVK
jgi:tRNA threonylcarbamoyl adenosine modification protein YeaZ